MSKFAHLPRGVVAHSTHVKGIGTFEDGVEEPRITVTLATGISEAECRAINLGYRDHRTIDADAWRDREAQGLLLVPKAGETLFRLNLGPSEGPRPPAMGSDGGAVSARRGLNLGPSEGPRPPAMGSDGGAVSA